jgi:hypothetical protein
MDDMFLGENINHYFINYINHSRTHIVQTMRFNHTAAILENLLSFPP